MPQKVVLDFDDASVLFMKWDLLDRLKDRYPQLKLSLFFIPFDYIYETNTVRILRDMALKKWKEREDWIQLIPHGLTHIPREFENADEDTCLMLPKAIDEAFSRDGLKYEKGFKAPQWLYNHNLVNALNKYGWWLAVDRNQPQAPKTNKFYVYGHSIAEPFWESSEEVWKLHGHITEDSGNGMETFFFNLFKIPLDAEFYFVTDYLQTC